MKNRKLFAALLFFLIAVLITGCGNEKSEQVSEDNVEKEEKTIIQTINNKSSHEETSNNEDSNPVSDTEINEVAEANPDYWDGVILNDCFLIKRYIGPSNVKKVYMPDEIDGYPILLNLIFDNATLGSIEELVFPETICNYGQSDMYIAYSENPGAECGIKRITLPNNFHVTDLDNSGSGYFTINPFGPLFTLEEIKLEGENSQYEVEDGVLFQHIGDDGMVYSGTGFKNVTALVCYPANKPGDYYSQKEDTQAITWAYASTKNLKTLDNCDAFINASPWDDSFIENLSLKKINYGMICNMPKLKTLEITEGEYSIAADTKVISNCPELEEIKVTSTEEDCDLFDNDGVLYRNITRYEEPYVTLIAYPPAKSGESYTILENTIRIYPNAFDDVSNLKKINVPSEAPVIEEEGLLNWEEKGFEVSTV